MVDLGKYINKNEEQIDPKDLLTLYNSKDTIASHTEPRPSQIEAFEYLTKNYDDTDIVLKLSTGIGKTAIGLFYLQSKMEFSGKAVVYLCPTSQLKEQVLNEAKKLGLKAHDYKKNDRFPNPECTMGKAIIVCTYDKLFNGSTVFSHPDVDIIPYAIVLDDAHAGLERIKRAYSISSKNIDLRSKLIELLDERMIKYHSVAWESVKSNYPYETIEIPYWIVSQYYSEITQLLSEYIKEIEIKFPWPLIRDHIRWCRFIIGPLEIYIQPIILPIQNSKSYYRANYKLFLTATLADDSILIRDLAIEPNAVKKIPKIESDKGIGERMIIVPALIDPKADSIYIKSLCKTLSGDYSIVVLCSSTEQALKWKTYGGILYKDNDVNLIIPKLQSTNNPTGIHVFTQRFDGIDLPDSSCRILIVDGLPFGESLLEKNDVSKKTYSSNHDSSISYKIEQGMGRAVRSPTDFAVIFLVGEDMANFIAKREILELMSYGTKLQIELAFELAQISKNEGQDPKAAIKDLVQLCLLRDENWKKYYTSKVKNPLLKYEYKEFIENSRFYFAEAERKSIGFANVKDYKKSSDVILSAIDKVKPNDDVKGYYLQLASNYLYEQSESDALELQRGAFEKNDSLFRPETIIKRPKIIASNSSIEVFLSWYRQFNNVNGPLAELNNIKSDLSYSLKAKRFEKGLKSLAPLFGAKGFRPEEEYSDGPDVMWSWPEFDLIIEAKNENQEYLHKKDVEQLLYSKEWYKRNYPARPEPKCIFAAKVLEPDSNCIIPIDFRVLTPVLMNELLSNLEKHLLALSDFPLLNHPQALSEEKIKYNLTNNFFIANYTERTK